MRDISTLFPPGYEWKEECIRGTVLYGISFLYSLFYFVALHEEYGRLFYHDGRTGEKVLRTGAKMTPYKQVLGNYLLGFVLLLAFALIIAIMHYLYYYQGSRSILLVRRLPERNFVWMTCGAGPLLAIATLVLTYGFLYLLYYGVYIWVTPTVCLP